METPKKKEEDMVYYVMTVRSYLRYNLSLEDIHVKWYVAITVTSYRIFCQNVIS